MATRERDVEDGWGGEETPEAPSVFEGRNLLGRKITLTLSAPPLALPGDEEPSTGSVPPPPIEPRTYDGWNADRLRRMMEGLLVATGHFRNGILLAPITAELVADLVAGRTPSIDLAPFDPMRQ